jgi:hypothetical protein
MRSSFTLIYLSSKFIDVPNFAYNVFFSSSISVWRVSDSARYFVRSSSVASFAFSKYSAASSSETVKNDSPTASLKDREMDQDNERCDTYSMPSGSKHISASSSASLHVTIRPYFNEWTRCFIFRNIPSTFRFPDQALSVEDSVD